MAKSTKPKKLKEENTEGATPEVQETVVENVPEVSAEPTTEEEPAKEMEHEVVPEPTPIVEVVLPETPVLKKENDQSLTMEERLESFIDARSSQTSVKLNDFLKSLFPVPKFNEPPAWLDQGANKKIKLMLTTLQASGKITIRDNSHLRLGTAYYPDSTTLKTYYYNLNTVLIEATVNSEK